MEIAVWLRELGLGQYEQAFRDSAVTADLLPSITDQHLRELGLPLGHRLRVLKAIASLPAADVGAASPILSEADRSAATGERRQVTVMFADLAGYTELSSRLDGEDVHGLLERFFGLADRIVAEHGGHVDKHIGDCVMAVFGAPVAHGNDPEHALRAVRPRPRPDRAGGAADRADRGAGTPSTGQLSGQEPTRAELQRGVQLSRARALWRAPRHGPPLACLHENAVGDDVDLPDQVQRLGALLGLQQRNGLEVKLLEGLERVLDRADEGDGAAYLLRVAVLEVDDGPGR